MLSRVVIFMWQRECACWYVVKCLTYSSVQASLQKDDIDVFHRHPTQLRTAASICLQQPHSVHSVWLVPHNSTIINMTKYFMIFTPIFWANCYFYGEFLSKAYKLGCIKWVKDYNGQHIIHLHISNIVTFENHFHHYHVITVRIETLGSNGPHATLGSNGPHAFNFIKDIGQKIIDISGKKGPLPIQCKWLIWLFKGGNSACILETVTDSRNWMKSITCKQLAISKSSFNNFILFVTLLHH